VGIRALTGVGHELPATRYNFTSIPRIRSESPAFDLNHPEAGIPVGVGTKHLRHAPDAPTIDATDGITRTGAGDDGRSV
jgi:cytochrome c oxidase subunit I